MSFRSLLSKTLGAIRQTPHKFAASAIEVPFDETTVIYAIGDVHGCLSLLNELESLIAQDFANHGDKCFLVMLGDYVDRGPNSAGVLDHLTSADQNPIKRVYLAGNHESTMLSFLSQPARNHEWLRFGGVETLRSYGVDLSSLFSAGYSAQSVRHLLNSHIPREHIEFLQGLHLVAFTDEHAFVHASIDPQRPIDGQSEDTLLWRDAGAIDYAGYGRLVVHGHTQVASPLLDRGRIAIDTGAFATGKLSAVRLRTGFEPSFLTTD